MVTAQARAREGRQREAERRCRWLMLPRAAAETVLAGPEVSVLAWTMLRRAEVCVALLLPWLLL